MSASAILETTAKIAMETKLSAFDWNSINNVDNPEEKRKTTKYKPMVDVQ